MPVKQSKTLHQVLERVTPFVRGLTWLEIMAEAWKLSRKLWRGMADEGMYEVLEHESRLEILDKKGRRARFYKRQKVRYLQNNIIAYQDHAWGDGKILIGYRCTPGVMVDKYRPGQKTLLLISLRDSKRHGDKDEFNMEWRIQDGFVRPKELWETEIHHRTKRAKVQVTFPRSRPPRRIWLEETLQKKKRQLEENAKRQLPDGRWRVTWQTNKPRLNERYQLHWTW